MVCFNAIMTRLKYPLQRPMMTKIPFGMSIGGWGCIQIVATKKAGLEEVRLVPVSRRVPPPLGLVCFNLRSGTSGDS